jgi:hypothetical protein
MAEFIRRLAEQGLLRVQRRSEVARFEGIILADVRGKSQHFKITLLTALQLIRGCDARRFARIQRHISWVVNVGLELGKNAEYNAATRTCSIDFSEPEDDAAEVWSVWHCARTLVHEATHGVLISWGIPYTQELRARIEDLCVTEERRFLSRVGLLQPELAELTTIMQREFDPAAWERVWTASRWQRALSALRRVWE